MDECRGRILIADDEEAVREILRRALQLGHFEVAEAVDGQDALVKAMSVEPDIILTDLRMPVRDGFWFIRALRSRPVFEATPILIVSGMGDTQTIQEGFRAGASDFVTKPFTLEELTSRVEAAFRNKAKKPDGQLENAEKPTPTFFAAKNLPH